MLSFYRIGNVRSALHILRRLNCSFPDLECFTDWYNLRAARILYNAGLFGKCRRWLERMIKVVNFEGRVNCLLETALLNARVAWLEGNKNCRISLSTAARAALDQALSTPTSTFASFFDPRPPLQSCFAECVVVSLMCYGFTGDISFTTITLGGRSYDAFNETKKLLIRPRIGGYGFVVWCHEALARALLRSLEQYSCFSDEVSADLLCDSLSLIKAGLGLCKAYDLFRRVPGLYNVALTLASISDSPLAQKAAVLMAQRIAFIAQPPMKVNIGPSRLLSLRARLKTILWGVLWDDLVRMFALPVCDEVIAGGYEPEPDLSEVTSESFNPTQLHFGDMLAFIRNDTEVDGALQRLKSFGISDSDWVYYEAKEVAPASWEMQYAYLLEVVARGSRGSPASVRPRLRRFVLLNHGFSKSPLCFPTPTEVDCQDCLRKLAVDIQQSIPEIYFIIRDANRIVDGRSKSCQATILPRSDALAIVVFSYDLFARAEFFDQNLYVQLNEVLVHRIPSELKIWSPFCNILTSALIRLPTVSGTNNNGQETNMYIGTPGSEFYRSSEYQKDREFTFGAFVSATPNFATAVKVAGPDGLVISLKSFSAREITTLRAFDIGASAEREMILSPNSRYVVTDPIYCDHHCVWQLRATEVCPQTAWESLLSVSL